MKQQLRVSWLGTLLLVLVASSPALATSVTFSVTSVSGGLFQYSLTIINTGGAEPIAGLNIINGNSIFGLTSSSVITAPPNWSFFPPEPGIGANELNFFSLSAGGDVPINGSLGGFIFQSTTNPSTISGHDFDVDFVGGTTGVNFGRGPARPVPEPTSMLLFGTGVLGVVLKIHRRRKGTDG